MTALENPRVTSIYGTRTDPMTGRPKTPHYGIDEVDTKGNRNVRAIWDTIKTDFIQGHNGGRGNTAYLYYSNTLRKLDQHLESFSQAVLKRQPLKQGDLVGIYGKTGDSTGLHLHEEVQVLVNGRWTPVEPSKYIEVPNKVGVHPGNNNLDSATPTPEPQLVTLQIGPVSSGDRKRIEQLAAEMGVPMKVVE